MGYRKTVISKCKALKYLDDRPVFEDERRRVNAWDQAFEKGGLEAANSAERNEIENIRREKQEADARNMAAFEQMMREGLEIKRQREQTASQNLDPNSSLLTEVADGAKSDTNPFSGEKIVHVPENPELKEIREERERVLCNQENVNMNHIMPPAPPSETEEGEELIEKNNYLAGDARKPPFSPATSELSTSWNKLQIESEEDEEEGEQDIDKQQEMVGENAAGNAISGS